MKPAPFLVFLIGLLTCASASAEETWRAEFDRLCAKTDQSMSISVEELRELVARCEKLKPEIEASANPQKKVFVKRLEACRNVFVFVIEASDKSQVKR
jgi:hypothetical protein